jgi:CRISPR-associated protein Cmr2
MLSCASELASKFREFLQEFAIKKDGQEGRKPSLSVGIVIAHHMDLLYRVRKLAKSTEKRAKDVTGKNALAITLSKRSGEDYQVVGHWEDLDKSLEHLIGFYRAAPGKDGAPGKGAIPVGTAYELRDLLLRLSDPAQDVVSPHAETLEEVRRLDAFRIIQRKLRVPAGKFTQKQIEDVERFLKARLGIEQDLEAGEKSISAIPLDELINELIIAQMLAHAQLLVAKPLMLQKEKSLP